MTPLRRLARLAQATHTDLTDGAQTFVGVGSNTPTLIYASMRPWPADVAARRHSAIAGPPSMADVPSLAMFVRAPELLLPRAELEAGLRFAAARGVALIDDDPPPPFEWMLNSRETATTLAPGVAHCGNAHSAPHSREASAGRASRASAHEQCEERRMVLFFTGSPLSDGASADGRYCASIQYTPASFAGVAGMSAEASAALRQEWAAR